jgi:NitT/TauT family transport system substrate-binding protein
MKRLFPALAAVCLIAASACQRQPRWLRVGYSPDLAHAAVVVGMASGRISRAGGIPVRASVYPSGPAAMEALLLHDVDVAYVDPVAAVAAYSRSKGRFVIVAGAASGGAALVASKAFKVKTAAELRDARVGTPQMASSQDVSARFYFGELGFTTYEHGGNFKIEPTPNTELMAQFASGGLDAAWTVEPWATQLVEQAGANRILDEAQIWAVPPATAAYQSAVVMIRKSLLRQCPKAVEEFLRLHARETEWINAHPAEAQQIFQTAVERMTHRAFGRGVIARAWPRVTLSTEVLSQSIQSYGDRAFRVGFIRGQERELENLIDLAPLKRATSGPPGS